MSAFMVADAHIDVLVDIAYQFRPSQSILYWNRPGQRGSVSYNDMTRTEIGRMLLAENARSVGRRYREGEYPAALLYVHRPTNRHFTLAEAHMTVACYEYQACESADWPETEAHSFCVALRDALLRRAIPWPDNGIWGWSDRDLTRGKVA